MIPDPLGDMAIIAFLITLDPVLKLPQEMRGAEPMPYVRDRKIRFPEIMHRNTGDVAQDIPASGADSEEGQKRRTGRMQPVERPFNTDPRLIHVVHRCLGHRTVLANP